MPARNLWDIPGGNSVLNWRGVRGPGEEESICSCRPYGYSIGQIRGRSRRAAGVWRAASKKAHTRGGWGEGGFQPNPVFNPFMHILVNYPGEMTDPIIVSEGGKTHTPLLFWQGQLDLANSRVPNAPKAVQYPLYVVKKAEGKWIGTVCSLCSRHDRTFVLRMAALPNQEKMGLSHFGRSLEILCRIGRQFLKYKSNKLEGSWIPRWLMASDFQMNGKFCWH